MTKKDPALSEQLRAAIENCGLSRYSIAKLAGIDQAVLSRFTAGKAGMSFETIDALGRVLGLKLVATDKPAAPKRPSRSRKGT